MIHGQVKIYKPRGKSKRGLKLVKTIQSESLKLIEPDYGGNTESLRLLASYRKTQYRPQTDWE
jgi:hypothetical protein